MHRASFLLITFLLITVALALPRDKKEKVYIVADSIIYNYKTGVSTYEGHVKVDQGSTHITADKLLTQNNMLHKIKQATAYGLTEPAHYWTKPSDKQPVVDAHANIIVFFPIDARVTLKKHVFVTQGENSFRGELVHYSKNDQTIIVPASPHARAVIIYNPNKMTS